MYNVSKNKLYLHSLRNKPEKFARGMLFYLFLKLVQINFVLSDKITILYTYLIFNLKE